VLSEIHGHWYSKVFFCRDLEFPIFFSLLDRECRQRPRPFSMSIFECLGGWLGVRFHFSVWLLRFVNPRSFYFAGDESCIFGRRVVKVKDPEDGSVVVGVVRGRSGAKEGESW
jgi:hypothetical protein